MTAAERRQALLELLRRASDHMNATSLAERFGVTRQIIVSDIALLRANGNDILSTQRGYRMADAEAKGISFTVICKHRPNQVAEEFYAVVDNGGKVENVTVEHPLYGQISAELDICSRYDADDFVRRALAAGASQLCDLTGGVHAHRITVRDSAARERILAALEALEILYTQ